MVASILGTEGPAATAGAICPVERVVVFYNVLVLLPIDLGVMARYGEVIHVNDVVRQSANGDDALRERHFLEHRLIELQNEFCHLWFPPPGKNRLSVLYQG
jgi:hypothetical protein